MPSPSATPSRGEIVKEWGRIGCIGFGGPPAHIALLRDLCVERRSWLSPHEFEDAIAACNLLPGPASTQLAIFCAWRIGGPSGALLGGLGDGSTPMDDHHAVEDENYGSPASLEKVGDR